ncbi:hypothetical protein T492DRAFT_896026 [Pavlovales sp. CCMP2436]|nr:hypothetical protein T492DRAFT_896026 [Pavlovales sp. CCMP2436]
MTTLAGGRKRARAPGSDEGDEDARATSGHLMSLLLEMRAEMRVGVAELGDKHLKTAALGEKLSLQIERLARAERGAQLVPHIVAPPAQDSAATRVVFVSARETRFNDLPADALAVVAAVLPADDELAAALSCRRLRAPVVLARERDGRTSSVTGVRSAFSSLVRLKHGLITHLEWLRAHGCNWYPIINKAAAESGQLEAGLQYALANGCDWDADCTLAAAREGHLAVLQWTFANDCPWDPVRVLTAAARWPAVHEWVAAAVAEAEIAEAAALEAELAEAAQASESIGDLSGDVSLGSDGILNVENSFARAGRGPQRGGAVDGLVEEGAEGAETSSASEST